MATVVIAESAVARLDELITILDLPSSTLARVRKSLDPLATLPGQVSGGLGAEFGAAVV